MVTKSIALTPHMWRSNDDMALGCTYKLIVLLLLLLLLLFCFNKSVSLSWLLQCIYWVQMYCLY